MLFDSGTPSLLTYTRDLAGDPDSAASELWSEARVKAAINDAYLEMREIARVFGEGPEVKRSYATTVASQLWYQLPSDFKRLLLVEINADGNDLSGTASPTVLQPLALDAALEGHETGAFSSTKYVAIADQHIAIVNPVSTGGSNALRITYECETSALSDDTDEPVAIPENHQYLICYKAAISLRASEGLNHEELMRLMMHKERAYRIWCQERLSSPEDKVSVAGLISQTPSTQFGKVVVKS